MFVFSIRRALWGFLKGLATQKWNQEVWMVKGIKTLHNRHARQWRVGFALHRGAFLFLISYPLVALRRFYLTWNLIIKACVKGSLAIGSKPLASLRKFLAYQMYANHCCFLTRLLNLTILFTNPLKFFANAGGNPSNPWVNSVLIASSTVSNSAWRIYLPFT